MQIAVHAARDPAGQISATGTHSDPDRRVAFDGPLFGATVVMHGDQRRAGAQAPVLGHFLNRYPAHAAEQGNVRRQRHKRLQRVGECVADICMLSHRSLNPKRPNAFDTAPCLAWSSFLP
ncbi:Uncharacterised protein [Mycobacteroides abscessus subsp. abscessus]|nr:Uncharacterised protein [Mycobacteroides abscessus subsp. abscessus]